MRIIGIPGDIRSEQLPNASMYRYRYRNLLGAADIMSLPATSRTVAETAPEQEHLSIKLASSHVPSE
jgi:hypothetical protein